MAIGLEQAVKAEAHRLGFDLVGITTPGPPLHYAAYESWLAAGHQAQLTYLETERARRCRADPRLLLPECQSILVLGMRYFSPDYAPAPAGERRGLVAAYAWGDDYHDNLLPRLQALVQFIENQAGQRVPNRWYTDTGPLLERDLAQRAGLGWIGKNTCLVNPRQGSYFFLAEILLGLALQSDAPAAYDYCGSCARCLQVCPTGCLLPGRILDAGRCIAYLTIELKGAIPEQLRPRMGSWVFGCDLCQQVCPWNRRFAAQQGNPSFAPRLAPPHPELAAELDLDAAGFNLRFRHSPLQRARRRGYLRNVAVALGNTRSPAAVLALARALDGDPQALVRAHAAWALGQVGGSAAGAALRLALQNESDETVQGEIRAALERFG